MCVCVGAERVDVLMVIVGTRSVANVLCSLPILQLRGEATLPVSHLCVVASVWTELVKLRFCSAFPFYFVFISYR